VSKKLILIVRAAGGGQFAVKALAEDFQGICADAPGGFFDG
jgi:hypothetical protein